MKSFHVLSALVLASLQPLGAVTMPYTNDFSGTGSNTAFTNADSAWAVTGGAYQFTYSSTTVAASTTSLSFTGMSGASFTMQTQFTITSFGSINVNGQLLGFGLFGGDSIFTGGNTSTSFYLVDWSVANSGTTGGLRILSQGDSTGFTSTAGTADNNAAANMAATLGTTYTLRLNGTYTGSTLNMTFGVFDAVGTTQIGTSATASDTSPLTGTNFGYRNRIGVGGGTFQANFDNFSVVPEPGTWALFLSGGALTVFMLRRRMKTRSV